MYALAVVLALYAMVPYVPIAAIPVAAAILALWRGSVRSILRDRHLYFAGVLSAVLYVSLRIAVGTAFEGSHEAWTARTRPFLAERAGRAISLTHLDPALLPDKLLKLAHQHFSIERDAIGDQSRSDGLWTAPGPHFVWLALLPILVIGAWRSRRDPQSAPFAAVLVATYGLALTVSFPEGRYVIPALPALAYFVLQGLRSFAFTGSARVLVMSAILAAMAWNSFALVSGPYEDWAVKNWQDRAGMKEAFALIRERSDPELGRSRDVRLLWPDANHEVWLYMQMLANLRVKTFRLDGNLAEEAPGEPLFAAVRSEDEEKRKELRRRGFQPLGIATDPVISRRVEVLVLNP